MTPAARAAAAIEILDRVLAGTPAERVLTGWARASRFAGARDRAAIRDHVFDALRCRRSAQARSGQADETGRSLMIGLLALSGADHDAVFSGEGHAPSPLSTGERAALAAAPTLQAMPRAVALDCPDWLMTPLGDSLGDDTGPVLAAMRARAPVFLRVNAARSTLGDAVARLAADGIATRAVQNVKMGLEVTENAQKVKTSAAYADGLVELQDASPQAAVELLPLSAGIRALDYCAGGGGKTLAMAARVAGQWFVHDAEPRRMADLPARATRAGVRLRTLAPGTCRSAAPFDLVLADVPCTGSGTWRRTPEAKWTLTPTRLDELCRIQAEILTEVASLVRPGGVLVYMTCSLLDAENRDQVGAFLARDHGFRLDFDRRFLPTEGGDGFYMACMTRL